MIFVNMLFGHLVGDYLLQNNWMALSKNRNAFRNTVHCLIYTISMLLFCHMLSLKLALLVFVSHWVIDYFSIAEAWLKLIRGRSIELFMSSAGDNHYKNILTGSFTSFVYIVTDNTLHLLLIWYGWKLIS